MVEIEPINTNPANDLGYSTDQPAAKETPSQKLKDIENLLAIVDLDLDPQTKAARDKDDQVRGIIR